MSFSVSDICDVFFRLEEKYDLNNLKIQDCYAWQLIRMYLYYDVARRLDTFGVAQQQSLSIFDKIKSFAPFFKNSIIHNPFKGDSKDYLVFDHPRKTLYKGQYRDIYSYFLVDYLESFEILEAPYLNNHISDKKSYVKYTDRIELSSYIYKKFNNVEFRDDERDLINSLQNEFQNAFDLNIDLEWILSSHILNFKHDYSAYKELFSKKKPKKIFVVVAYENQAVVAAAKDLKIEVIELQHGTVSPFHLGYSYKENNIAYFPDKILTFGDYWLKGDSYPVADENIVPIGFSYFQEESKAFKEYEVNKKQIIFISQGVIGKYLSEIAYELAGDLKDYKIIYKLHPGEYATWKQNYSKLVEASKLDNFEVIDNSKTPLYQLFAESNYQIGAFSTAIYEGLMFNCKTFVFDLPGVEYLSDLIDEGYVCKVKDSAELFDNLESFTPKVYDKNFFFKDFDSELLMKVIR